MPAPSRADRILIIEDESLIRLSLRKRLEQEGYVVDEAEKGREGLDLVRENVPDLVLLDYRLPDVDGLTVLQKILEDDPGKVVILMTAHSTVESAVQAMRLGAFTYLNKPFDMEELLVHIAKGLETTKLRREVERLRRGHEVDGIPALVAESESMKQILGLVRKVNQAGAPTVILRGESGVGKDLLAHLIHATSSRSAKPFQTITCTALPENLLETELFGHEKGSFTDARQRKQGLFELADRGTVFLDEIGDMSLSLQAKLLRFLEDRTIRRVGGTTDIQVDVRILAATNRDLEQAVAAGAFRQDLFYRLAVIPLDVPALRDRAEDIVPLAKIFADRFAREFKRPVTAISEAAAACMRKYPWPGNVRELRNVIERAIILGEGRELQVGDLPPEIRRHHQAGDGPVGGGSRFLLPEEGLVLEEVERDLVIQALDRTNHNQTRAARLLGMTRDQIRYRVEKFKLPTGGASRSGA